MDGIVNEYVVNKVEVLDPHSVEEVEHSGYALVLYKMCIRDRADRIGVAFVKTENGTVYQLVCLFDVN